MHDTILCQNLENQEEGMTANKSCEYAVLDLPPTPFPLHKLPFELRKSIIETSALREPETALALATACHEFQAWVDPIIYRHISLVNRTDAQLFLCRIREHPTRRESVRSLLVGYLVSLEDAYECVKLCRHVKRLAFWSTAFDSNTTHSVHITSAILSLPLTSLSIYIAAFLPGLDPDFSLLPNIKYLSIIDSFTVWKTWTWKGISSLTNLTHISFDNMHEESDFAMSLLDQLLKQCGEGIKVVTLGSRRGGYTEMKKMRSKFVTLDVVDHVSDWARHVRGEDDNWVKAERVLALEDGV